MCAVSTGSEMESMKRVEESGGRRSCMDVLFIGARFPLLVMVAIIRFPSSSSSSSSAQTVAALGKRIVGIEDTTGTDAVSRRRRRENRGESDTFFFLFLTTAIERIILQRLLTRSCCSSSSSSWCCCQLLLRGRMRSISLHLSFDSSLLFFFLNPFSPFFRIHSHIDRVSPRAYFLLAPTPIPTGTEVATTGRKTVGSLE